MKYNSIILGANGYLGKNLAWYLKQKGENIKCYDIHEHPSYKWMNYNKLDVTNENEIAQINLSEIGYVYMFAGKTGTYNGFEEYKTFNHVNVNGLNVLLNEMVRQKSKAKIIFPSTRLVYKGIEKTALPEDAIKETNTIYALNKLSCEHLIEMYSKVFNIRYTTYRICVPYGNVIPNSYSYGTIGFFLKKAKEKQNIILFGDGELRRTFTHVEDICNAIYRSRNKDSHNKVFNIGGEDLSLIEAAEIIAKNYNVGIEFIDWPQEALKIESGDTIFDDDRLTKLIGDYKNNTLSNSNL